MNWQLSCNYRGQRGQEKVTWRSPIKLLWAKTSTDPRGLPTHPLVCHCLDVAAVASGLWQCAFADTLTIDLKESLGQSAEQAERLLAFWAGLHDIGKASPGFQALDEPSKRRLQAAGFGFHPRASRLHGTLTTDTLDRLFASAEPDSQTAAAARGLATAVGGHHGEFPSAADEVRLKAWDRGGPEWEDARTALVGELARVLDVPQPIPHDLSPRDHPFFMFLAGLVSVADWIGSSHTWFPFESYPHDTNTYFANSLEKAGRAIDAIGWTRWRPSDRPFDFATFFGFDRPNPMQEQVLSLPTSEDAAELVIIEAPMGEGKTEAALYLVDRWNQTKAERGCYVAMPTQATANAMFDRFRSDYLAHRYPDQYVDLQLVHGHAALSSAYQQLREIDSIWDREGGKDAPNGAVVAGEWFSYRKRGLLGPFGVGTVDQSLLAAMQARHSFVRLFGLAGKAVIFDEVHAFDTYTSDLLDRLLAWLGAMECPVVLLSATLPPSRRRQLIQAYTGQTPIESEIGYPRVTRVSSEGVDTATWDTEQKRVELSWIDHDPVELAEFLAATLTGGGCAAVICNTVAAAQDTFTALDQVLPDPIERHLFHARFPFSERDRREKLAIARFGKDDANRPSQAVLVATQVIEQSLDLDFDLMISEVAPVDLLLQRSGRMHRHDRERPSLLADPRLTLMKPRGSEDGVPKFGDSSYIYGDHLLLKTWIALRDKDCFRVPDDMEDLICEVYEREAEVDDEALASALAAARDKDELRRRRLRHQAAVRLMPRPDLDEDFWALPGDLSLEEDNPELHNHYRALTRWQDRPSVEIICLETVDGRPQVRSGDGLDPVDLAAPPDDELADKLVRRSVRISGRAAAELLNTGPPDGWRSNSLLRHNRAVVFDESGHFTGNTFELRLDPKLGIVIPRSDEGDD